MSVSQSCFYDTIILISNFMTRRETSFTAMRYKRVHPLIKSENHSMALFIQPSVFECACKNNNIFSGF